MSASTKSHALPASRGARFLDLVKQNKLNISPQLTKKLFIVKPKETPEENKEYLKLSAEVKHDPEASPVSSILSKRSFVSVTPDSPFGSNSAKRKRVGFRDPVSSTKEYLITEEEERLKSNSLIRRLRYEAENADEDEELVMETEESIKIEKDDSSNDSETQNEGRGSPESTSDDIIESSDDSNKLSFKNKAELLDYITLNLSVDELLERLSEAEEKSLKRKELMSKIVKTVGVNEIMNEYFDLKESNDSRLNNDQTVFLTNLLNEMTNLMEKNKQVKHIVIDALYKQNSELILDHSLQMNPTNSVCDKIGVNNIVNYLIHKVSVEDTAENDDLITQMNQTMIKRLIIGTQASGSAIIPDRNKIQELMLLLFRFVPKIEIFDTVQDFVRKILQKN